MSTITATSMVAGRGPNHVERDVRSMLLAAGVGQFNVVLLTTAMFLMPRTTDPSAQATIMIVEGAQRLLGIPVTGQLDDRTLIALRKVSGAFWTNKTWMQVYGDILDNPGRARRVVRGKAMSDYIEVGDSATTVSIGALVVGSVLLFMAMR